MLILGVLPAKGAVVTHPYVGPLRCPHAGDAAVLQRRGLGQRQFLAVSDPGRITAAEAHRLGAQANNASTLGYLLLAAARPLSSVPGE